MRALCVLAALVVAGVGAASCHGTCSGGGVLDPSCNNNEQFMGTIPVAVPPLARIHFFDVKQTGELSVTLQSLTPPLPLFAAVEFLGAPALPAHDQCVTSSPIFDVAPLVLGRQPLTIVGNTLINPGSFCIVISDTGNFTVAESYVLIVSHP